MLYRELCIVRWKKELTIKRFISYVKKQGQQLVDIWSLGNFKVKYLTEEELLLEKK